MVEAGEGEAEIPHESREAGVLAAMGVIASLVAADDLDVINLFQEPCAVADVIPEAVVADCIEVGSGVGRREIGPVEHIVLEELEVVQQRNPGVVGLLIVFDALVVASLAVGALESRTERVVRRGKGAELDIAGELEAVDVADDRDQGLAFHQDHLVAAEGRGLERALLVKVACDVAVEDPLLEPDVARDSVFPELLAGEM